MLRIVLGISREDFCTHHNINFNTLTSIELDRLKLSSKQLQKIIGAFLKEGLHVDALWIKEAKGIAPTRFLPQAHYQEGSMLENWARFFNDSRKSVILQIKSNEMEPFYSEGDLVGGIWHTAPHLLLGKRCIVRLEHQMSVGTLFYHNDLYSLVPSNTQMHHNHLVFQLHAAHIAEVLWHIRKHSHQIPELSSLEINGS
jgi:hypothetical protein